MTADRSVLDDVVAAIEPASEEERAAAEARLAAAPAAALGRLREVALRLAAARHTRTAPVARKHLILCAADHGGVAAPATAATVRQLAGGTAPVSVLARAAGAAVVLVDCGVRGGAAADLGRGVLAFRLGEGSDDLAAGPAVGAERAIDALQTGIALVLSLASEGLDLLALGQVGDGGDLAAAAVVAGLLGPGGDEPAAVTAALAGHAAATAGDPLAVLAHLGGLELGVLAGVCLGAAAVHVPVVLDGGASCASALLAARIAPPAAGYLVTSHAPTARWAARALAALAVAPLCDLDLTAGAGAGAAALLPLVDEAARLLREVTPATLLGLVRS